MLMWVTKMKRKVFGWSCNLKEFTQHCVMKKRLTTLTFIGGKKHIFKKKYVLGVVPKKTVKSSFLMIRVSFDCT